MFFGGSQVLLFPFHATSQTSASARVRTSRMGIASETSGIGLRAATRKKMRKQKKNWVKKMETEGQLAFFGGKPWQLWKKNTLCDPVNMSHSCQHLYRVFFRQVNSVASRNGKLSSFHDLSFVNPIDSCSSWVSGSNPMFQHLLHVKFLMFHCIFSPKLRLSPGSPHRASLPTVAAWQTALAT